MQRLELEKNVLGVYLSKHPISYIKQKLKVSVIPVSSLDQYISKKVAVILSLTRIKTIVDKK